MSSITLFLNTFSNCITLLRGKLWGIFFQGTKKNLKLSKQCKIINPANVRIGDNVWISHHADIQAFSATISIGNDVWIGHNADIQAFSESITIGNDVEIAPYVSLIASNHIFTEKNKLIRLQGRKSAKIVLEDNIWIGTKATILAGVTIGKGSVIGAGAVVTKNIPPFSIAVGIPARVVKQRT